MENKLNYKDFNEMTHKKICELPGIGRTTATRIIANRPYRSDQDLFKIKGLGKATLEKLGIKKAKKERKKWMYHPEEDDGILYPHSTFAYDTDNGKLDFFWRIPRERRKYFEE